MSAITIRHTTTYKYKRAVAFGRHRMMLRPRDDADQTVREADIKITPAPTEMAWTVDRFGNHVAEAEFEARASELRFESTIRLNHAPADLCEATIEDFARVFPFVYPAQQRVELEQFMAPRSADPQIGQWAATFLSKNGATNTGELLRHMTRSIRTTFKHAARQEKGIQNPLQTLTIRSGSCRDHAMLMIAALRSLGMAARFVSGYLHLEENDDNVSGPGGNTHAWVQAFLPGPGWVDLDPSCGVVGNQRHIRVAVVPEPDEAVPLQGTWIGEESDHLGMSVTVKVKSEAEGGTLVAGIGS
jgi:transglutaminase-like putative cysteine protease